LFVPPRGRVAHLNDPFVASETRQQLNELNIMSTNNAATPAAGVAGRERRNQGAEECVDGHVFPAEARKLNDAGWVFARSSIWKKGMTILATFLAVQACEPFYRSE
jgi:hypothetical protein